MPSQRNPRPVATFLLGSILYALPPALLAQQDHEAPKVLVIQREFLKPGKDGPPHEKTEAASIAALRAAKSTDFYIAASSLSGAPRTLFLGGYPSYAAWQQAKESQSPALTAALSRAALADGDLLSASDQSVWLRRDDLSSNTNAMGAGTRVLEITQLVVKPGHNAEFLDAVKMLNAAYKKGIPEEHWTIYELAYGTFTGPAFLVISARTGGAELDSNLVKAPAMGEAMGEAGLKKLEALSAASVETITSNLFYIDPGMSYPPDAMVQAEPAFWLPKPAPTKKPPTKTP